MPETTGPVGSSPSTVRRVGGSLFGTPYVAPVTTAVPPAQVVALHPAGSSPEVLMSLAGSLLLDAADLLVAAECSAAGDELLDTWRSRTQAFLEQVDNWSTRAAVWSSTVDTPPSGV